MTEPARTYPEGEFAILELFGHTTLIGRIAEVERFGAKMLAIEPIFRDELLQPVFHGGAAIYRLTPCSAEVAFKAQPRAAYEIGSAAVRAIIPPELLAVPHKSSLLGATAEEIEADREIPF